MQERGGKGPVVSAVAAGGNSSAFLTRAPDEFPDGPGPQLWQRYHCHRGCPGLISHLMASRRQSVIRARQLSTPRFSLFAGGLLACSGSVPCVVSEPSDTALICRLQIAISAVSQETSNQQAGKLLKPLMIAVDMVFGSAAALSATFGSKVTRPALRLAYITPKSLGRR